MSQLRLGLPKREGVEVLPYREHGMGVHVRSGCNLPVESIWRRVGNAGFVVIVAAASPSSDERIATLALKNPALNHSEGKTFRWSWNQIRTMDAPFAASRSEIVSRIDQTGKGYLLVLPLIGYTDAAGISDLSYSEHSSEFGEVSVTLNPAGKDRFDRVRREAAIDESSPRMLCLAVDGTVVGFHTGELASDNTIRFVSSLTSEEFDDLRAIALAPPWGCPLKSAGYWGIDLRDSREGFGTFWK